MKNNNRINFPDEKKILKICLFIAIFYLFIFNFYVLNESVLHALWQRLGYRSAPALINQPTNQKAGSFPKSNVHLDFFGGIYILLKKNWKKNGWKEKKPSSDSSHHTRIIILNLGFVSFPNNSIIQIQIVFKFPFGWHNPLLIINSSPTSIKGFVFSLYLWVPFSNLMLCSSSVPHVLNYECVLISGLIWILLHTEERWVYSDFSCIWWPGSERLGTQNAHTARQYRFQQWFW